MIHSKIRSIKKGLFFMPSTKHNLLVINASINGALGNSSKLTQHFLSTLSNISQVNVIARDLNDQILPHLSQAEMAAWMTPAEQRTERQQQLASFSDELIAEVDQADTIVIGLPMYNFGVPSNVKAWIDRIARAGVTFQYTELGPVGLLSGKKVIVLAARGGFYQGTPKDTQTHYVSDFFQFIGLSDIEFVYAEGLATEQAEQSIADANQQIEEVANQLVASAA